MNKETVKNNLKKAIRDMILSDLEVEKEIPDAIVDQFLQNYGFTPVEKSDLSSDLDIFVQNLQKWIEDTYTVKNDSNLVVSDEPELDSALLEKYLQTENEYCEVTSQLAEALDEAVKLKETYSQYFMDECRALDVNIDVLSKKCQLLKAQFFVKLYGEENALKGHLALQKKLKEDLSSLKKNYSELLEYNKKMGEIQNDKTFCELFRVYKELKQIEQMTEIIVSI